MSITCSTQYFSYCHSWFRHRHNSIVLLQIFHPHHSLLSHLTMSLNLLVIKKIKKLTYNFISIIWIQKSKNVITRRISIKGYKVRINLVIKWLKKLYWFYFFLFKLYYFFIIFSLTHNFECVFKNSQNSLKSYKSIKFF